MPEEQLKKVVESSEEKGNALEHNELERLKALRDEFHGRVQEELRVENALVNDAFSADNPGRAYERWQEQKHKTMNAITSWHAASDAYLNAVRRSKLGGG